MVHLNYAGTDLTDTIEIHTIYTIHYYEYQRNFSFDGEIHNFWEFICVDRGDVNITAGDRKLVLHKDEIAFHEPMEFHDVHTSPHSAPNLVVIAFDCQSPAMDFFRKKILKINQEERLLLASVLREAGNCFASRLDDPYLDHLELRQNQEKGSQQMLLLSLVSFLLHLMRRTMHDEERQTQRGFLPSKSTTINSANEQYRQICGYLEDHLGETITLDKICRDNLIGRSQLLSLFHKKTGLGVIRFFNQMKIDHAKTLIRQSDKQFSQIARELGYASVGYFSRQFRMLSGMSPSEYAQSIKALSERSESAAER